MMDFIELHRDGERRLFNVRNIKAVAPERIGCPALIWMIDDANGDPWRVDETYDEIVEKIKEVSK